MEENRTAKTETVSRTTSNDPVQPDRTVKSVPLPGIGPSDRTQLLKSEPANRSSMRNLTARFSLEVFRKKKSNPAQKKEEVSEYFGRNLTKYTSVPIENVSPDEADSLPMLGARYDKLEVFGEGGQGIISAAREHTLNRIVALKTLRATESEQPGVSRDFISEAKVTAQLDHPSIIPIYALGKNDSDHLQLAMKLVNGKTLREHLKNITLNYRMRGISAFDERSSLYKRLELFLHVCDAMVYAHHRRIMHCDLKPENIMIGEYMEVYLMDWGLAKPIPKRDDKSEWVRPKTIAGTPRYLSPEAVAGNRFDERADIFALGLILQEIATLQYAVSGADSSEVMHKILDGALNPPEHLYGFTIDRELKAIIGKATAHDPADRYQSVRMLADDLRSYMQGNEVSALPDNPFMKILRWTSRHRMFMLLGMLTALAVTLGTVAFSVYRNLQQTREMGERSEMTNRAYGRCFAATSLLDREILAQEKNLSLISGLAARMLSSWTVQTEKKRFLKYDRDNRLPVPPDAVHSHWYQDKVSFSVGMCKAVPEADADEVSLRLQQISPLVYTMRETILDSGTELAFAAESKEHRLETALQSGRTVKSIYIGLKEGIQFGYPWRDIYDKSFDPRKRPWYVRGKNSDRPTWGKPYIGADYQMGLCLPCSMRICDEKGNFYGVAGLELTFNKAAEILHRSGNTGYYVMDSALIDANGRIIASSDKKKRNSKFNKSESVKNIEIVMEYYATPKIRHAILSRKFGVLSDYEPGRGEVLYLFAQMKTLDWICVQKLDFEAYRLYFRRRQLIRQALAPRQPSPNGSKARKE